MSESFPTHPDRGTGMTTARELEGGGASAAMLDEIAKLLN